MEIHLARDGSALGIFSENEVREGLAAGRFRPSDLAWRQGMPAWTPLADWPEFAGAGAPAFLADAAVLALPAWERGPSFRAFFTTLRDVILEPTKTFDALPRGGFGRVLGFQYAASLPAWFCGSLLWAALFAVIAAIGDDAGMRQFGELGEMAPAVVSLAVCGALGCVLLVTPLLGFLGAGIVHLFLLPWSPSGGYAQTFRANGYVQGSFLLFGFIPCLNYVSAVWSLVCTIIALSRVHRLAWWKVTLSLLLPACLLGSLVFLALILAPALS